MDYFRGLVSLLLFLKAGIKVGLFETTLTVLGEILSFFLKASLIISELLGNNTVIDI